MEQGRAKSWGISELGEQGILLSLPHIGGFQIAFEQMEAQFQMSQYERTEETRDAIRVLRGEGRNKLADAMLRAMENGDE